jgi:cytochrome b
MQAQLDPGKGCVFCACNDPAWGAQIPKEFPKDMNTTPQARDQVPVWDLFVRVFHWSAVGLFFVAYLTEDELIGPHVWAGYLLGILIVLRVIWGIIGPRHARFSDFLYGPAAVLAYLKDLFLFSAKRYLGHSPAGGAMVLALLLAMAVTIGSGLLLEGAEGKGPLAPLMAGTRSTPFQAILAPALADEHEDENDNDDEDDEDDDDEDDNGEESPFAEAMEELHEVSANLTLLLVILHIGGVLLASFVHRENLARAMVTGRKRRDGEM